MFERALNMPEFNVQNKSKFHERDNVQLNFYG